MNRFFTIAAAVLTAILLAAGTISAAGRPPAAPAKTGGPAETISGDRAYKANCTRCHSELPKLEPRGLKTVLMHMRVRANIPENEARAILAYLTR